MLIQLFFFILLLFGVASLAIDLGLVHLSQTQMQTAADGAALEGLRGRDQINAGDSAACVALGGPDAARRCTASEIAGASSLEPGYTLDASTNAAATADPDLNALQYLHPDRSGIYLPSLQSNSTNLQHGDMVSGCFTPGVNGFGAGTNRPTEDSSYNRSDFSNLQGNCNNATQGNDAFSDAFLVRLRRTDGRNSLDVQPDPPDANPNQGTSSSGKSLPLIFGLSLPIQKSAGTDYSPRVHGITVRATGIADAKPASQAGPQATSASGLVLPGWGPLAIELGEWTSIAGGSAPSATTLRDGGNGVLNDVGGNPVGLSLYSGSQQSGAKRVGDTLATTGLMVNALACGSLPTQLDACGQPVGGNGYIPIYSGSPPQVVGFGFAQICAIPSSTPAQIMVTPQNNYIACANASAAGAVSSTLPPAVSLLAPALVR